MTSQHKFEIGYYIFACSVQPSMVDSYLVRYGSAMHIWQDYNSILPSYSLTARKFQEMFWYYDGNTLSNIDYETNTKWYMAKNRTVDASNSNNSYLTTNVSEAAQITLGTPWTQSYDALAFIKSNFFPTGINAKKVGKDRGESTLGAYLKTKSIVPDSKKNDFTQYIIIATGEPIFWDDGYFNNISNNVLFYSAYIPLLTGNQFFSPSNNLGGNPIQSDGKTPYHIKRNGKCLTSDLSFKTCNNTSVDQQWYYNTKTGVLSVYNRPLESDKRYLYVDKTTNAVSTVIAECDLLSKCAPSSSDKNKNTTTIYDPSGKSGSTTIDSDSASKYCCEVSPLFSGCEECTQDFFWNGEMISNRRNGFSLTNNGWVPLYYKLCNGQVVNKRFDAGICPLYILGAEPVYAQQSAEEKKQVMSVAQFLDKNNFEETGLCKNVPNFDSKPFFKILDQNYKEIPAASLSTPYTSVTDKQSCCNNEKIVKVAKLISSGGNIGQYVAGDFYVQARPAGFENNWNDLFILDVSDGIPRKLVFDSPGDFITFIPVPSIRYDPGGLSIYRVTDALDPRCVGWCPWGKTCNKNTDFILNYCSGIDGNGNPRLNTDETCKQWCDVGENMVGKCGEAAGKFCKTYPENYACRCQNVEDISYYKEMVDMLQTHPDCKVCKAIPSPLCWAPQCSKVKPGDDQYVLDTPNRTIKNQCDTNITICNQLIQVSTDKNIEVNNNLFQQQCGYVPDPNCNYDYADWTECINGNQSRTGSLKSNGKDVSKCDKTNTQQQSCSNSDPKLPSDTPVAPPVPNPTPTKTCSYLESTWGDCIGGSQARVNTLSPSSDPSCPLIKNETQPCKNSPSSPSNQPSPPSPPLPPTQGKLSDILNKLFPAGTSKRVQIGVAVAVLLIIIILWVVLFVKIFKTLANN